MFGRRDKILGILPFFHSFGFTGTICSPTTFGVTANICSYDSDDLLGADSCDNNGNTINSLGTANTYDFENHLIQHGSVIHHHRARSKSETSQAD